MTKTIVRFIVACSSCVLFIEPACTQYQINHFTTENGLPSNGIKGLQWDESTGFLWIATEAGVVRYNGMGFKTFDVTSNPEFGSNRIVCLLKNYAGKILAGGEEGNFSLVNNNKVELWFNGSKKAKYNYNHYAAAEASDTLFKKCYKTPWSSNFAFFDASPVSLNDTACVALAGKRLYYYGVSTAQPVLIKGSPENIKKIFTINNQLYCLNTANEFFACDVYSNRYIKQLFTDEADKNFVLHHNSSYLFWQQGKDNPVLIEHGKAWVLEKKNNKQIQCRLVASGIPDNTFFRFAVYKKNGNCLFLGSASKGIYIIHQNQLLSKQPAKLDINQKNSFYSQIELPDGNILTNEGIVIGDNQNLNNYNIGNSFMNSVFAINDNSLIYAIRDSIFMYNTKTYTKQLVGITNINEGFSLASSGKQLYFANQNGIAIINKNSKIDFLKRYDEKKGMHMQAFTMLETSPGNLAIATCDGLLGFDTKKNSIDTLLKIPAVCIRTLHKEGDYIFIGTYGGGYFVMKHGVIKAMPLDTHQYLKYAHCFIQDTNGFFWISTNNGLFKVKLADIIEAYEKNLPQIYYHYLGKEDGMETTEMNGGCMPCALQLKNGNFSFPTMDGLLWFNPLATNITLPDGDIYTDRFVVDGKEVTIADNTGIQLPVNSNKLEISLAINAWCKKENLYLDYKLNNKDWIPVEMTSGEPKIVFNNLGYGNYVLRIRKMNGFGTNNYSYSNIGFTIATPFYHQWWFRVLLLLLLTGVGYLIFRFRLRQYAARQKKLERLIEQKTMDLNLKNLQLERNNRIKLRLISIINHDIMTPLKFMHYAGKALVDNKGNINEAQQFETIAEITETAKDMEQLSSQILNWIIYHNPNQQLQKEEFDLRQLIESIFRVLKFPAKEKNTQLKNDVPVNFVVYQYMEAMRVMIYNLVANGLNFTRDGVIAVRCHIEDDMIILEVTDTGLGMTEEQVTNILSDERIIASVNVDNKKGTGLGYLIIKDLLKMMDATLDINSIKNKGTTVFVSIPVA